MGEIDGKNSLLIPYTARRMGQEANIDMNLWLLRGPRHVLFVPYTLCMGLHMQVRIQDLCKGGGGGSRDFADIAQRSCGDSKNLGIKMGGRGCNKCK